MPQTGSGSPPESEGRRASSATARAGRLLDRLENAAAVLAGALLVGSFVVVILEVFCREFFSTSFTWVIEMSENALIWATLLGAPWVLRGGGHVRVDLLESVLGDRLRRVLDVFVALIGVTVSIVLVWFGTTTTLDAFSSGRVTLTSARLPEAWIIIVIPIAGALLALEFVRQGFRGARGDGSTLDGTKVVA